MSPPSLDNSHRSAQMVGGDADHPAGRPVSSAAAGSGRHRRDSVAYAAAAVRLPEELDYRLRGLRTEPTDHVPATPTKTEPTGTEHHQRRRRRHGALFAKSAGFLAVAALGALLLQAFIVQPFAVPGNAMASTLQAGDRILVVKSGLFEDPIRGGQIVVFHPPRLAACTVTGGRVGSLVLRVVGLPGQTIWSVGDTILVDGRPLRERGWYDPRFGQVGSTPIPRTTLAPGHYFVMADNRSDACDSRVFGPITKSSIVGEGIAIIMRQGHVFFRTL
jgi:signal peptidase I